MPRTPEEYKSLRNKFKPNNIKFIFLLESPPVSGAYFYDPESLEHEWLFKAMMKIIGFKFGELNVQSKKSGLDAFKEAGYYLIDATYKPVNQIEDRNVRNITIMEGFDGLLNEMSELKVKDKKTPVILIKANIFALFNNCLKSKGFNIINEGIVVPFPSHGQQGRFYQRMNEIFTCQKVLKNEHLSTKYLCYGVPCEYVKKRKDVKAIILGADPSNFSNSGETVKIKTVFDLGGQDERYFRSILTNINEVGLNLKNIYVQNLVRNFMTEETAKNKLWLDFVELWKPLLKQDLDLLNPGKNIPVFATAECILNSLLNPDVKKIPAKEYFEKCIVIKPEQNFLERTIIPCFRRHYPYKDYPAYVEHIKKYVK